MQLRLRLCQPHLAGGGAPALPLPGGARLDRARLQEGHPHRPGQDPGERQLQQLVGHGGFRFDAMS